MNKFEGIGETSDSEQLEEVEEGMQETTEQSYEEKMDDARQQHAIELARDQALKDQDRIKELEREIAEIKGNTPEKQQREDILKRLDGEEYYEDIKGEIPRELLNDKDFILRVLKKSQAGILEDISEGLKSDRGFMLEAIKASPDAFEAANESLRDDESFVLEALAADKGNSSLLYKLPDKFRNNKDFILKLSEVIGSLAFEAIGKDLRDDKELILHFAEKGALTAIRSASRDLQKDEEFVLQAVETILQRSNPERIDGDIQWALNGWDDPWFQDKYFKNQEFMDKVNRLKQEALLRFEEKQIDK